MMSEIFSLVMGITQLHPVILIGLMLVFIVLALKVFQFLLRVVLTGIAFGLFPVGAFLLGFPVDLTFGSIFGSALFGVVLYFVFSMVRTGFKIIRFVLSPFRRLFRDKPKPKVEKVIIKEKEPEKKS